MGPPGPGKEFEMEYRVYTTAALEACGRRRWRARIGYTDSHGARRAKTRVLDARGKKAAREEMEAWREEMELRALGLDPGPAPELDVAGLVDGYVDMLEASGAVERSTVKGYRYCAKRLNGRIGHLMARELTTAAVQEMVADMAADGCAPSSIRHDVNLLRSAAEDGAARLGIWRSSPIGRVRTPKLPAPAPNSLDEVSRARLLGYLSCSDGSPVNASIKLAVHTGMREGEICGLRWRDVDLGAGEIRVANVLGRRSDGGYYDKEPKTSAGRRTIPLSPELSAALSARRLEMMEECASAGLAFAPSLYVMGSIDGAFLNPHGLWRSWRAIARGLGLKGVEGRTPSFHDLRHTFATVAIAAGSDVKSVASILGHSDVAMTLNVYANADKSAKERAMAEVSASLGAAALETDYPTEAFRTGKQG